MSGEVEGLLFAGGVLLLVIIVYVIDNYLQKRDGKR